MESIIRIRTRVPAGTVIFLEPCVKRASDFGGAGNAVTRTMASELKSATIIATSKAAPQMNGFRIGISSFLKLTNPHDV
jgi:hypothetical protein